MNDISENQDQYILLKLFATVVSHLDFLAFAMSSTWRENRAGGTVSALICITTAVVVYVTINLILKMFLLDPNSLEVRILVYEKEQTPILFW